MKSPHDATDLSGGRREGARDTRIGPGSIDRLDRSRERLVRWREALEAAGFRTNLSLMPPCSIAARRVDSGDDHWVTVLPTGLIALERRDLGACASTWSRATEQEGEPSVDDVLRTVRSLFARGLAGPSRARQHGQPECAVLSGRVGDLGAAASLGGSGATGSGSKS